MTTLYAGTQCYQMFYSSLLHDVLLQTFVRALIRRIKLRLNSRHRRYFLLLAEWIFKLAFVVFSSIFTSLGLFVLISTFISCWSFHSIESRDPGFHKPLIRSLFLSSIPFLTRLWPSEKEDHCARPFHHQTLDPRLLCTFLSESSLCSGVRGSTVEEVEAWCWRF